MIPFLIQHIKNEKTNRFPVWMMRQAGRYLPSYQAIRKSHSFWEMVSTPSLASEVSLLPLNELDVDAVIFFSDILTLPYGMKVPVRMEEKVGPVVETPLTTTKAFEIFQSFDFLKNTGFVGEALSMCRKQMAPDKTLIGFAGAPWTVATYLVEGRGKNDFSKIKTWMHTDPSGFAAALSMLGKATTQYLVGQRKSGADMVQLFDTWISEMPEWFFKQYYLDILNETFETMKNLDTPAIYFGKGASHLMHLLPEVKSAGMGVDAVSSLTQVAKQLPKHFLQGNLEPLLLRDASEATVRAQAKRVWTEAKALNRPVVMNLGHGLVPTTPVSNVKAYLEEVRREWN